jgi:hypothetical protein
MARCVTPDVGHPLFLVHVSFMIYVSVLSIAGGIGFRIAVEPEPGDDGVYLMKGLQNQSTS